MSNILSFLILLFSFNAEPAEGKPFVVVELFTSEGCSSCPPADRLLSEIVDTEYQDAEVIGLSFHVDYWDYLGWKDPYADSRFSQRQRTYARKLYSNQVYTPQMVVNGKHEFVGSNKARWENARKKVSTKIPSYSFELKKMKVLQDEIVLQVESANQEKVILNAALVERSLSQAVTRGENRGRELFHDNVVRNFKSRQFTGEENEIRLEIPFDMNLSNSSLILYAQKERSWEIIAASKTSLGQR